MTQHAALPLYHRSAWQKAIDENKADMGMVPAPTQDMLDRDLVRAVLDNHQRGLREMSALGANVNRMLTSPVRGTPLHLAVEQGSLKIVVTLLQLGADPFLRDTAGQTPRDLASRRQEKGSGAAGRIRTVLKLWEQRRLREHAPAVNDDGNGGDRVQRSAS